eukprot:CAMPEP_0115079844 /NCGR_PEP_ID=MMETSP0227-20121206/18337_1 /TAXON_ID=89957 /ORGANISM="Polarella glacialis, Strain CCMP 1383" /LENGTH=412 /DNA_ID=CAMNT_0002467399 /DNA_START=69 /DNA_END=1307 /DNA_ORIENTATION=+
MPGDKEPQRLRRPDLQQQRAQWGVNLLATIQDYRSCVKELGDRFEAADKFESILKLCNESEAWLKEQKAAQEAPVLTWKVMEKKQNEFADMASVILTEIHLMPKKVVVSEPASVSTLASSSSDPAPSRQAQAPAAQPEEEFQGGWLECMDEHGVYYFNQMTGQAIRQVAGVISWKDFCTSDGLKAFLEAKLTREAEALSNQARFILMVVEGDFELRKKKVADILKELQQKGFKMMSELDAILVKGGGKVEAPDPKANGLRLLAGSATFLPRPTPTDYDYLLGMPLGSLTVGSVDYLNEQHGVKRQKLEVLRNTTVETIWDRDLGADAAEGRSSGKDSGRPRGTTSSVNLMDGAAEMDEIRMKERGAAAAAEPPPSDASAEGSVSEATLDPECMSEASSSEDDGRQPIPPRFL